MQDTTSDVYRSDEKLLKNQEGNSKNMLIFDPLARLWEVGQAENFQAPLHNIHMKRDELFPF